MAKEKQRKAIVCDIIQKKEGEASMPYEIMDDLIERHHAWLQHAKIALAWRHKWKEDVDGVLRLSQTRRTADVDVQLHGFDFVIMLNFEAWNNAEFSHAQQEALIDHELTHCQPVLDDMIQRTDEANNRLWRLRRHDVEEFVEIAERHGMWRHQLEALAKAAIEKKARPLLAMAE